VIIYWQKRDGGGGELWKGCGGERGQRKKTGGGTTLEKGVGSSEKERAGDPGRAGGGGGDCGNREKEVINTVPTVDAEVDGIRL